MQDFVLDKTIMTDVSNEYDNSAKDCQPLNDDVTLEKTMDKDPEIGLPANRVIRKRFAARTIAIHLSALPPELTAFKDILKVCKGSNDATDNAYLSKHDLPDKIHLTAPGEEVKVLSRDEAWDLADEAAAKLEWDMLPDNLSGKAAALFSTTGQGVYANYGRPTMDFSGFFYDYTRASGKVLRGPVAPQQNLLLGPLFITVDAISAAGFTALGHFTRDAPLTNKTVLSDIVSTGVYEGSTAWTSAKLGVFTGARAIRLAAVLPIPGAHLAAVPVGFMVGAVTAIFAKRFANQYKDKAIDASYRPGRNSGTSAKAAQEIISA